MKHLQFLYLQQGYSALNDLLSFVVTRFGIPGKGSAVASIRFRNLYAVLNVEFQRRPLPMP